LRYLKPDQIKNRSSDAEVRRNSGQISQEALKIALPIFILILLYNYTTGIFLLIPPMYPLGWGINQVADKLTLWALGVGYVAASGCQSNFCEALSFAYYDFLALSMLLYLTVHISKRYSLSRAIQLVSFLTLIEPAEIYLTERDIFYTHVTMSQVYLNVIPWFTNEDLFVLALTVFALVTTWISKGKVASVLQKIVHIMPGS
jgi:hypothetical protein